MNAIRPGQVWRDSSGNRIQAHGGSIIAVGDRFYWYGEDKSRSTPGSGIWHWGIRAYSSVDLASWVDEGTIIPAEVEDRASSLHFSSCVDRPHIVFNDRTGKFVCWLKVMGHIESDLRQQTMTVLESDHILGPYSLVAEGIRPVGMFSGDFDIAVDPRDQKGYLYFERVHGEIVCADLTDDYRGVTGYYSTHFPRTGAVRREAPAHFERRGRHYLLTSGLTWYFPNPSEWATAGTYHGPWVAGGLVHAADERMSSFDSQISSVFRHPGKEDLYIAMADRWVSPAIREFDEVRRMLTEGFREAYADGTTEPSPFAFTHTLIQPVDTSVADYVWLPITFSGDTPRIEWRNEWHMDEFD